VVLAQVYALLQVVLLLQVIVLRVAFHRSERDDLAKSCFGRLNKGRRHIIQQVIGTISYLGKDGIRRHFHFFFVGGGPRSTGTGDSAVHFFGFGVGLSHHPSGTGSFRTLLALCTS